MEVILITIKLLYGTTYVEFSNHHMVTYNVYMGDSTTKDAILYDFEEQKLYKINPQLCTYQVEGIEKVMNGAKNILLDSYKLGDTCYLDTYDCETYIETYRVAYSKIYQGSEQLKIKKIYGKLGELERLKMDKLYYSVIPFIGRSINQINLFTFSCYEINSVINESNNILIHEVEDIKSTDNFSDYANSLFKIIYD